MVVLMRHFIKGKIKLVLGKTALRVNWGYIAHGVCITHIGIGSYKYVIMYKMS